MMMKLELNNNKVHISIYAIYALYYIIIICIPHPPSPNDDVMLCHVDTRFTFNFFSFTQTHTHQWAGRGVEESERGCS